MFQSNSDTMTEKWQSLAREGEIIQAIKIYRETTGADLVKSRDEVNRWIAEQPTGTCHAPIELNDSEAMAITLQMARNGAGYEIGDDYRRATKAIDQAERITRRILERSENATTGPMPCTRHIRTSGHHWLRNTFGDLIAMQWQPGVMKWCYSGQYASLADVDTKGWEYIAPCPMPLLSDEVAQVRNIWNHVRNGTLLSLSENDRMLLSAILGSHLPPDTQPIESEG